METNKKSGDSMNKSASMAWTVILGIFFVYLFYQTTFAWDEKTKEPELSAATLENKTAFVMISEVNNFGIDNSGIKKLQDSLEMWSFDKKREKVLLRHRSLIPDAKTQMMVIYDRGYESFERYSEVLPLLRFPYKHYFKEKEVFSVEAVGEAGDVYLSYKNQRVHLKPGDSYRVPSIEGYRPKMTTIKNYGLYEKKQFVLAADEVVAIEMEQNDEPKKVNIDEVEIMPLTEVFLTNTP